MQVISDAKELEKHTYIKTRNPNIFPKKERLGLAQRMMNEASDLVADLMEANDLLLTDPQERELRYRAQRSALLYLDDFDHWLRDDLGLVYGRYMDDFYIISGDKLLLREILKKIEAYIKPLGLRLNGKTQIFPLKNGIDFLGFHTYLTSTGKVVRKVRAKSIDNMKRKIRKFRGLVDRKKMTLESVSQSYASWTGHISHGNTYHLRQNMDAYFFAYFPELKPTERRQDSCLKPSEALPTRQKSSSAASTARRSSGSRPTKTTPATLPTASPS